MTKPGDDFRQKADQADVKAASAKGAILKSQYEEIAKSWRGLADISDREPVKEK